jgi:hypothetical protein
MLKFLGSSAIKGYQDSALAKSEESDCVVRAFAAATNSDYDTAHAYVAETFKRKYKKGVFGFESTMQRLASEKQLGRRFTRMGEKTSPYQPYEAMYTYYGEIRRCMTVKTFLEKYQKGTYLIVVRNHLFCLKDGVVVGGNYNDATSLRRRIQGAYLVK